MGEAILARRGGGGGTAFAYIAVEYPSGSTVTCTNGTKTLTAGTTSGQWVFEIPSAGTWTVQCVNSGRTLTQSFTISAKGQLGYKFFSFGELYSYGNEFSGTTGGWTGSGTKNADHMLIRATARDSPQEMHTVNQIDVTGFTTAKVTCEVAQYYDPEKVTFYVGSASRQLATGENTLDISGVSGSVAVRVETTMYYNATNAKIYSVTLE